MPSPSSRCGAVTLNASSPPREWYIAPPPDMRRVSAQPRAWAIYRNASAYYYNNLKGKKP